MPLITNPEDLIKMYLTNAGTGASKLPVSPGMGDLRERMLQAAYSPDYVSKSRADIVGKGEMLKPADPGKLLPTPDQPKPIAAPAEETTPSFELPKDDAQAKAREAAKAAAGAGVGAAAQTASGTGGTSGVGGAPVAPLMAPHAFEGQYTVDPNSGFHSALSKTFVHEGGYNARDANGYPVNMGINAQYHPNVDVKNLTKEQAAAIYKRDYWDAIGGDNLPPQIQALAFDTAVISGVNQAKKLLAESGGDPAKFLALRTAFEEGLVKSNPEKYGKYAQTWAGRRASYGTPKAAPLPDNTAEPPKEPGTKVGEHRKGWFWNGTSWDKAYARGGHIKDLLALSRSYR